MALNTPIPDPSSLLKSSDNRRDYTIPFDGGSDPSDADRRSQVTAPVSSVSGNNQAADKDEPVESQLYKVGYINPSSFLMAPYDPVYCEGDTSGTGTEIRELDIDTYGDDYDPTAPIRVRTADNWHLDSDHDGHLN